MSDQYDVFLCYSRRNSRFVNRIEAELRENQLVPWLDTTELEVGSLSHQSIERGIEHSRYFCFVISEPSLTSYYTREVEFEAAFTKMVREKRTDFILPLLWQKPIQKVPLRLATRQYLDFSKPGLYTENMRRLVKKINIHNEAFTGERWFKAFEISALGEIVGIGDQSQVAETGPSVKIFYQAGIVTKIEMYENGELRNYKRFTFDDQGRVHENLMYKPPAENGMEWEYIDTWRYYYDPVTQRRIRKVVDKPGARSRKEIYYDGHNHQTEERIVTLDGLPDTSFGYTRKIFSYSPTWQVVSTTCFDERGNEVLCPSPGR